jgi:hypothetical protein
MRWVTLTVLRGFKQETSMPIDKPYAYHEPSQTGLVAITKLRELFSQVERTIKDLCPPGRQQSIAVTKNEEAAMWAIKAVVFNDPTSKVHDEKPQDVVKAES